MSPASKQACASFCTAGKCRCAVGGADEVVERDVEPLPDVAEHPLHLVAVGQRILALLLARRAEHVLRVLVVPHQETGVVAGQPLVARDDVGGDLLVGRAEVRTAVDEVDGRRQEERISIGLQVRQRAFGALNSPVQPRLLRLGLDSLIGTPCSRPAGPGRRTPAARSARSVAAPRHLEAHRRPSGVATGHDLAIEALARHLMVAHADRRRLAEHADRRALRGRAGRQTTVISVPGRFFFICTGA